MLGWDINISSKVTKELEMLFNYGRLVLLSVLSITFSQQVLANNADTRGLVNKQFDRIAIYNLGDGQCENRPNNLADINFSRTPTAKKVSNNFTIGSHATGNCTDSFADYFGGEVYIPADDTVVFYLNSDDGSKLFINGNLLINNDGVHGAVEVSQSTSLTQGWHLIEVQYFNKDSDYALDVSYSSAAIGAKTEIPNSALRLGGAIDTDNDGVVNYFDRDIDGDGLIEISNLADLDEIRNNLTGTALFGDSTGCGTGCTGFELTQELNFDTSGDGYFDASDDYWDSGKGWQPIGTEALPFTAVFNGNGFTLANLTIVRDGDTGVGLFGYTGTNASIEQLTLTDTRIIGDIQVGALIGKAAATQVHQVTATGKVAARIRVGGLIGEADNSQITQVAHIGYVSVVDNYAGGVIGNLTAFNGASSMNNAFHIGSVVGVERIGGIAGSSDDALSDVFSAGYVFGNERVGGITSGISGAYIERSYTVAQVKGGHDTGAILGSAFAPNAAISSTYWLTGQADRAVFYNRNVPTVITEATFSELNCPTAAGDNSCAKTFYADWDDSTPIWQFGSNSQLPALVQNGSAYFVNDFDADGVSDLVDVFPSIAIGGLLDSDNDGAPNDCNAGCLATGLEADLDNDNDGVDDASDAFPLDPEETLDTDSDGIGNNADLDDDNDGVNDSSDDFPFDANEAVDTDGDGVGNNADLDDDNDGVNDDQDALPLDATEWLDSDLDGIGDNADLDDDNDGFSDIDEAANGTSSTDANDKPSNDIDGDFVSDLTDIDDNNNNLIDIRTLADLDEVRNNLAATSFYSFTTGCLSTCVGFELLNDLDFDTSADGVIDDKDDYWNGGLGWQRIGYSVAGAEQPFAFAVVFNGNNHTISNLTINRPTESLASLFGRTHTGANISNLTLDKVNIIGRYYAASLAGSLEFSVVNNVTAKGNITGRGAIGGLLGSSENSSYASLAFIGQVSGTDAEIGGIAGYSEGDNFSQVAHIGPVSGPVTVAGIIGNGHSDISDAYTTGKVTGERRVGGILGYTNNANIERVLSTSTISADTEFGALIGTVAAQVSSINSSYYLSGVAPQYIGQGNISGSAVSLSLPELSCPQSSGDASCSVVIYNDWDEATPIWYFGDTSQLPALVINQQTYRIGDYDNDGVSDDIDLFPAVAITGFIDSDNDGAPDNCAAACLATGMTADTDDDNDGYLDVVEAANTAPVITEGDNYAVTMDEDNSPTEFSLTLNATDVNADTLTWSILSPASNGLAAVSGNGNSKAIAYQPNDNYYGTDSFIVQVSDNTGGFAKITLDVTINPVNDLPTGSLNFNLGGPNGSTVPEGKVLETSARWLADVDGLGDITLVWRRNGTEVVGQGEEYLVQMTDIGATLTVEAGYVDGSGFSEIMLSETTPTVIANPQGDYDNDGLWNQEENDLGTDINNPDSDIDGVNDSNDVFPLISLNGLTDTDGDGMPDSCDQACLDFGMTADIYPLGILYVNDDATCDASSETCGDSWGNAFPYLQDALAVATPNTKILLAQGVYYPDDNQAGNLADDVTAAFVVKQNIQLLGGFADDGSATQVSDADPEQFITVLSADIEQNDIVDSHSITVRYQDIVGNNANNLVKDNSHMNRFVLSGVTVTGVSGNDVDDYKADSAISLTHSGADISFIKAFGNVSEYGSVLSANYNRNCTLDVSNVYAANNSTTDEAIIGSYNSFCQSTNFSKVTLDNNHGYSAAFYIYSHRNDLNFDRVSVLNEDTDKSAYGEAIYSAVEYGSGSALITNSTFYRTGGVEVEYSSAIIENSTFVETQSPIYASLDKGKTLVVRSSTFVNNTSTNWSGGVHVGHGDVALFGNLFIGNSTGAQSGADNVFIGDGSILIDGGYNLLSEVNSVNGGFANTGGDNVYDHFNSGTSFVSLDAIESVVSQVLADNGGDTLTLLPIYDGAVNDVMPKAECMFEQDQRGVIRGFNNACDIGAVELANGDYLDTDGDNIPNDFDLDDDNDGYIDDSDTFPLDSAEWLDSDGDGMGNNADTDDDNDGISDAMDVFPLDAGESIDSDFDGIGNNADTDDDNDSVLDGNDAFPLDANEWLDTDLDGIGNNADTDDDNDGILDVDDAEPLIAFIDNQAPVFSQLEPVTFEATGALTPVELATPSVTDNGLTLPIISSDLTQGLAVGNHQVTWTATDAAGNQSTAVQTVNIIDSTGPEFTEVAAIVVNAKERLTDVKELIQVTAVDIVDGDVVNISATNTVFTSGNHQLTVMATDKAGNAASTMLAVTIYPEVSIQDGLLVAAGASYPVTVNLTGDAPRYPVSLSYQLVLNGEVIESSSDAITEGAQGTLTVSVPSDVQVSDNLSLQVTEVDNATIGDLAHSQLMIIEENIAPQLTITLQQNGQTVSVLDPELGTATLTAQISDVNAQDSHDLLWTDTSSTFADLTDALIYTIEPSELAAGVYSLEVSVIENNSQEALSVTKSVQFVVEQLPDLTAENDTDLDGVSDGEEGYSDTDSDGIVDYLDNDSNTTRLPVSSDTEPMQTSPGLTMSLGSLASAQGSSANAASIAVDDLALLVSADAADTQDEGLVAVTPLYNFTIDGLAEQGSSVAVVIPLASGYYLPADAIYRKYNERDGWFTFVEDEKNSVSSALSDSHGNCPPAGDDSYTLGLSEGDNCFQLIIEDGGANDADFMVNASVEDPGAIVIESENSAPELAILNNEYKYNEGITFELMTEVIDADGDEVSYLWQQLSGPTVNFENSTSENALITLPEVVQDEMVVIQLTVSDGKLDSTLVLRLNVINQANSQEDESLHNAGSIYWLVILLMLVRLMRFKRGKVNV